MVEAMKVSELKAELQKRGLSVSGNKQPLKMRLLDALATGVEVRTADDTRVYPNPEDGFNATAHWVELHHNGNHVKTQLQMDITLLRIEMQWKRILCMTLI